MLSISRVLRYHGLVTEVLECQHLVTRGEIKELFYACGVATMLPGLSEGLMFGNMGVGIPTYVRNDDSDAVRQGDAVNTATKENARMYS